jgi:hypothetical protein
MASKASKSPSGEDREQKNVHKRKPEEQGKQAQADSPRTPSAKPPKHETNSNRGYDEDQPGNPIRSTGSIKKEQESLPTGEPDAEE